MNIEEFLELSAGKWFSHRTSHNLAFKKSEEGKSEVIIETLTADHPEVIQLCQQYKISPSAACFGTKVTWHGIMGLNDKKHTSSTVLVTVPDDDNPNEGRLLRAMSDAEKTLIAGRYKMGSDEALTLITESETMSSEERLWFASPNLRMRVSVLKHFDGSSLASFTSEIRMGVAAPAKKASEAANSAS
jgi:CpeS-like protein.